MPCQVYHRLQITETNVSDFATKFMKRFHIGRFLFKCNAGKEKGIPVIDIFRYLFCMMFSDRSIYMQMKTGTFEGAFSKNTIYRFLNDAGINWQRFTMLLSAEIICRFMKPLTDENGKMCLSLMTVCLTAPGPKRQRCLPGFSTTVP